MLNGQISLELQREHEVGRVPGGAEDAAPLARLVHRTLVAVDALQVGYLDRLDPDHRHLVVQHLGHLLGESAGLAVPARAIHEQAVYVGAVLGLLVHIVDGYDLEVEVEQVDGNGVAARVVLLDAGEKGLREVEAGDPERGRLVLVVPLLEEVEALDQVAEVAAERLQRRIRVLRPHVGHLADEQRVGERLQLLVHDDQALDGLLQVLKRAAHDRYQLVVALHLLRQHRVHALLVLGRILLHDLLEIEVRRQFGQYVLGYVHELLVRVAALRLGAAEREQNGVEEELGGLQVLGDVHVLVHAEDLRVLRAGQLTNELDIVVVCALGRYVIDAAGRQLVHVVVSDARVVEVAEYGLEAAAVPVVGDAAAVVALARHVGDGLVGHVRVLVDEHLQLAHGDAQVGLVEAVGYVEAERTELASLLGERVEEAEAEEQALEHGLLVGLNGGEEDRIADRIVHVRLEEVHAQAGRRLVGHLDAVLQHRDGKLLRRIAGQPQAELGVRVVRAQLLAYLLERAHPRHGQVAVLQAHPGAVGLRLGDEARGDDALALAQRDGVELGAVEALVLRELEQLGHRVGARRQDEHQRYAAVRVRVRLAQVEGRRLDELLAEVLLDELGHRQRDLVRTQAAHEYHLLELVELVVVGQRHGGQVGLLAVVEVAPARVRLVEVLAEAGEDGQVAREATQLVPALVEQPRARRIAQLVLEADAARQEEHVLGGVQLAARHQQRRAQHEREEQLVLLEERATHVAVQVVGEVVLEVLEAPLHVLRLQAVLYRVEIEIDEPLQRVLVHRIDVGQVGEAEEECGRVLRHRLVLETRRLDLLGRLEADLLLLVDVVGDELGVVERENGRLVLQNVALRRQREQYLVLDLLESALILSARDDQRLTLLLELGTLFGHHDAEQLVFEALGRDHEVEQSDLN